MSRRPIRFLTFLAPKLYPVYEFITRSVGKRLGLPTELVVGTRYRQLLTEADISFVCGLAYVRLRQRRSPVVEPLVAPVLQGPRYHGRPIYFSDIIVHRDSPFRSFADLRGGAWAYNEWHSHSGCGVVRYHLARLGDVNGYFGKVIRAGWHECSICKGIHVPCVSPASSRASLDVESAVPGYFLNSLKSRSAFVKRLKNVVGVVCKPESVELPPQSIDLAFICDTYHHFEFPFPDWRPLQCAGERMPNVAPGPLSPRQERPYIFLLQEFRYSLRLSTSGAGRVAKWQTRSLTSGKLL